MGGNLLTPFIPLKGDPGLDLKKEESSFFFSRTNTASGK